MRYRSRAEGCGLLLAAALCLPHAGIAQDDDRSLVAAVMAGKASLKLRYRYEFVDEDGFDDNANASTLLLRLNYTTGEWQKWTGFVEFDHVFEVLLKDFNSGAGSSGPDRDRYPVVADPEGPDLNQLYLQYAPDEDWRTRLGRQRIVLDDERFVGGVAWRQNEQTYDSVSLQYEGFDATTIFYSYVANVNRVFGSRSPLGRQKQNTHLLNARVDLSDEWNVAGYGYRIDDEDVPAFSTSTLGLRVDGELKLAGGSLELLGEIATQSDAGNAPAAFDAGYFRLQGIFSAGAFSAGAGFESLGSDNGQGFRTPLATLHAFNGWADQFLLTPPGGLEDLYIRVGYKYSPWTFQLIYHDFSAESGGGDYGSELDLAASRGLGDRYDLLLKFASFEADATGFTDTTKFWLMLTARF